MSVLGELVVVASFTDRGAADKAWGALTEAGIPSSVITDPGMLGRYSLSLMVERDDLDRARETLQRYR